MTARRYFDGGDSDVPCPHCLHPLRCIADDKSGYGYCDECHAWRHPVHDGRTAPGAR
ncbi:hypothetical protein [Rhodococcus sp. 11-3]|uniref:hypothetical protein n=1 Tax=Rhodococcus sp. 11-3 TaxID=2854796 RepID=UPI00203F6757|nr:hypothetical protein [Rhodococcus sp. 11-3]USC16989.1 hypothetical protein KZJ41_09040 [Rhodococcus sp. 11-3]